MNPVAEAFAGMRHALESAGVRYAIGGSWASTTFGEPRFTNDVDVVVDVNADNLEKILGYLPSTYYADHDDAAAAISMGRPFNIIFMPIAFKFDLFPARAYPLGDRELDRAMPIARTGLSESPTPFVTPEDILLAKLHWYAMGGETSEMQWRDIMGVAQNQIATLDYSYLERGAAELGVSRLLPRVFAGRGSEE